MNKICADNIKDIMKKDPMIAVKFAMVNKSFYNILNDNIITLQETWKRIRTHYYNKYNKIYSNEYNRIYNVEYGIKHDNCHYFTCQTNMGKNIHIFPDNIKTGYSNNFFVVALKEDNVYYENFYNNSAFNFDLIDAIIIFPNIRFLNTVLRCIQNTKINCIDIEQIYDQIIVTQMNTYFISADNELNECFPSYMLLNNVNSIFSDYHDQKKHFIKKMLLSYVNFPDKLFCNSNYAFNIKQKTKNNHIYASLLDGAVILYYYGLVVIINKNNIIVNKLLLEPIIRPYSRKMVEDVITKINALYLCNCIFELLYHRTFSSNRYISLTKSAKVISDYIEKNN